MTEQGASIDFLIAAGQTVGRRATAIGASIAGLAAWAFVAGYLFELAYFLDLGAPWVVPLVSTQTILAAGTVCIVIMVAMVVVAILLKVMLRRFGGRLASYSAELFLALPVTIALMIFLTAAWQPPWLLRMVVTGAPMFLILLAVYLVQFVFYHFAAGIRLPLRSKVLVIFLLPTMSGAFPWLGGYCLAQLDLTQGDAAFPVVTFKSPDEKSSWVLVTSLGENFLLTTESEVGDRSFRLVGVTDVAAICHHRRNKVGC